MLLQTIIREPMKCMVGVVLIIILGCSSESSEGRINIHAVENNNEYPLIIDSLGLQHLYDKTKWSLYCIYCDDSCLLKEEYGSWQKKAFASLDLKFEGLRQKNDTLEFQFRFYYDDSLQCDITSMYNYGRLSNGAGYQKGSDSILYYTAATSMPYYWERGSGSRYAVPLQPEVLNYIRKNKDGLHPWFYREAKKRRIVQ